MTLTMDQHIRNQMSLMAWIMAFLCGWVMFISAHAAGGCDLRAQPEPAVVSDVTVTARQ